MEGIRNFVLTLLTVSAASALIDGILPDGGKGTGKYLKFLTSLTVLVILLAPLAEIVRALPETAGTSYRSEAAEVMAGANSVVARHIERALTEKFGFDENELDVRFDGIIRVTAREKPGVFSDDIRLYILKRFSVEAEVTRFA